MIPLTKPAPQQPECQGANPLFFEVQDWYQYGLEYCDRCPVQAWCLDTVNPADHYYDGVVGGLIWQNGRIIKRDTDPTRAQMDYMAKHGDLTQGTNQRLKPKEREDYDWASIQLVADGHLHWRAISNGERREVARMLLERGLSTNEVYERTRLNGTTIKQINEGIKK